MNGTHPLSPQGSGGARSSEWRDVLRDAIRYWEPRRLIYNIVLAAIALAWLIWTWPHFRRALTLRSLYLLSILAILANLCYSAAYLADIPVQYSSLRAVWRRRRWGLWLAGMLFAAVLANYWIADEIYPSVR